MRRVGDRRTRGSTRPAPYPSPEAHPRARHWRWRIDGAGPYRDRRSAVRTGKETESRAPGEDVPSGSIRQSDRRDDGRVVHGVPLAGIRLEELEATIGEAAGQRFGDPPIGLVETRLTQERSDGQGNIQIAKIGRVGVCAVERLDRVLPPRLAIETPGLGRERTGQGGIHRRERRRSGGRVRQRDLAETQRCHDVGPKAPLPIEAGASGRKRSWPVRIAHPMVHPSSEGPRKLSPRKPSSRVATTNRARQCRECDEEDHRHDTEASHCFVVRARVGDRSRPHRFSTKPPRRRSVAGKNPSGCSGLGVERQSFLACYRQALACWLRGRSPERA